MCKETPKPKSAFLAGVEIIRPESNYSIGPISDLFKRAPEFILKLAYII